MKRIYIAGALNSDSMGFLGNCHRMIDTGNKVRKAGYAVFIPCLDVLLGLYDGGMEYHEFFNNSVEFLKVSDAVFLTPGWEDSAGTRREIEMARRLQIPVCSAIKELLVRVPPERG